MLLGLRRGLPIMMGYLPVGFAFGALAVKNGVSPALAAGMAVLMFSGSGQFVFVSLWGAGASALAVSAAVTIINLRYVLMSVAEAPWLKGMSRLKRLALGWGVTDETFVVHAAAVQSGWRPDFAAMLACNASSQLAWVLGCSIGAFFGSYIDDTRPLGLDYAITAMFIALLVPQCSSRIHLLVALFSLCLSIALKAAGLESWNIALATIAGATLGLALSMLEDARGKKEAGLK